jgi:hypothetical protein
MLNRANDDEGHGWVIRSETQKSEEHELILTTCGQKECYKQLLVERMVHEGSLPSF